MKKDKLKIYENIVNILDNCLIHIENEYKENNYIFTSDKYFSLDEKRADALFNSYFFPENFKKHKQIMDDFNSIEDSLIFMNILVMFNNRRDSFALSAACTKDNKPLYKFMKNVRSIMYDLNINYLKSYIGDEGNKFDEVVDDNSFIEKKEIVSKCFI